jgi:hypothetical protein
LTRRGTGWKVGYAALLLISNESSFDKVRTQVCES